MRCCRPTNPANAGVRRHFEHADKSGFDHRAVIDALRPDTQRIWMGLPEEEKRRFIRRVFRYWEIIRSRIPPETDAIVSRMRDAGQLEIKAGRITDLVERATGIEVRWLPRDGSAIRTEQAQPVLNCTGPETDYTAVSDPLVQNLMRRGLIRPGPAGLGLMAAPDGAVMGRDGVASAMLYTLGSAMRGVLWEVLAVPEIRVQAEQLAAVLTEKHAGSRMPRPAADLPRMT